MTLPLALPVLGSHEALGMLLKLVANFGVCRQVLIETRMGRPELRVVYQLWILRQLLDHFLMLIEVASVKVRNRPSSSTTSASPCRAHRSRAITVPSGPPAAGSLTAAALPLIAALLRPHELAGIVI